ncbi:MAG: hypothetical protein ABI852_11510 [Gemmatimonadaceae bacterium]
MPHWIFTKFRPQPSRRLRILARFLQGYGIAIGLSTVVIALAVTTAPHNQTFKDFRDIPALKLLLTGALECASLLVIGRALLKRERWGGYLAIVTLTAPILSRLRTERPYMLGEVLIAVGACATLFTVWKELRSARDLDLAVDEDLEPDAPPDPIPSRGYGEPRFLKEPNPTTISTAASTPLPINNPRAN